jgi:hypothetical protein
LLAILLAPAMPIPAAENPTIETIVLVRHGEKPDAGLGQLSCQGLNRALALPNIIQAMFGKPDYVFAPDPAHAKPDHWKSYDYVRPLATIEPTAIRFALPVNTQFGQEDDKGLVAALEGRDYRNALVLVAWEHRKIEDIARALLADNGADSKVHVPSWAYEDFDSIYVIRISRTSDGAHATFEQKQEHLDGQSKRCPGEQ